MKMKNDQCYYYYEYNYDYDYYCCLERKTMETIEEATMATVYTRSC